MFIRAFKGDIPGHIKLPVNFFGDEWAEEVYGDQYEDVFKVCELKQYQKKIKTCGEGVWFLFGVPPKRYLAPIEIWLSWFKRGLYIGPHTYISSLHDTLQFSPPSFSFKIEDEMSYLCFLFSEHTLLYTPSLLVIACI